MEKEQLEYADKILYSKPRDVSERWLIQESLKIEKFGMMEEGHFPIPDLDEVLEQLVNDGLISKILKEEELDILDKYDYSITTKGYDLVNKDMTYEEFLKNKVDDDKRKADRQKKEDIIQNLSVWQLKYSWLLSVIAIIISILAIIFS